ncbi:MAG: ATP-dependent DNA helicase RecG [Parcubacteria group bacterium Gr01-1014_46]|nr:MAG: ATP-dependent DNA helicase RecG [Parcubacteria group bacterium Gr01-1014_46]
MDLKTPLEKEFRLTPGHRTALKKMGISTLEDLLYHFPVRYGDTSQISHIENLRKGDSAVVFGTISGLKTSKAFIKKIPMSEAMVTDDTGKIKLVWFNQPYIAKMMREGANVRVEGKIAERKGDVYMSNPKIEMIKELPNAVGDSLFGRAGGDEHSMYPVYPESKGVTSYWMYHTVQKIFSSGVLDTLKDPIPENILKKYSLPGIKTAFIWIHAPKNTDDALSARKRFAFQEIFFIQLEKQKERKIWTKKSSFKIETSQKDIMDFVKRFPFEVTKSQMDAISSITYDFKRGYPMSRLLEGDVGSGKTAVAATTIYAVTKVQPVGMAGEKISGNLQIAYMVPTEILAKQHYENFISYFNHLPIKIALITGSECKIFPSKTDSTKPAKISKSQLLKWVANGEIPILIGTHALISKSVTFKHLAFVVIDEQHRFGTLQRQKLTTKNDLLPHLLSMTATPIPRTLALTVYGDLDLTVLEGMPAGRKPIITKVILPNEREKTYEEIRHELKKGRQLYVICPRIDEPDPTKELAVIAKSVKLEAERLDKEVFGEFTIDILHSKMTPTEKEDTMQDFLNGKTQILVATSVVEVGVNVPNATMIIIEGAERFGLSQLHQLRGRVIRSNHQAYCFVFAESNGQKTKDRMKALYTAKNGFELAEFDLAQRGAGELYGRKQWGISDIAMEAIKNIKMVEASRVEAIRIVEEDVEFKKYPLIQEYFKNLTEKIHFE